MNSSERHKPILSYLVPDQLPQPTLEQIRAKIVTDSELKEVDPIADEVRLVVILRGEALDAYRGLETAARIAGAERPGRGVTKNEIVSKAIVVAARDVDAYMRVMPIDRVSWARDLREIADDIEKGSGT